MSGVRTNVLLRSVKALCSDGRTRSVRFIDMRGAVIVQTTVDGCAVTGGVDESCDPPRFVGRGRNASLTGDA